MAMRAMEMTKAASNQGEEAITQARARAASKQHHELVYRMATNQRFSQCQLPLNIWHFQRGCCCCDVERARLPLIPHHCLCPKISSGAPQKDGGEES